MNEPNERRWSSLLLIVTRTYLCLCNHSRPNVSPPPTHPPLTSVAPPQTTSSTSSRSSSPESSGLASVPRSNTPSPSYGTSSMVGTPLRSDVDWMMSIVPPHPLAAEVVVLQGLAGLEPSRASGEDGVIEANEPNGRAAPRSYRS
jgi:hypothetical protein